MVDKAVAAVPDIHDLPPGVIPGGRAGGGQLADTTGSGLHSATRTGKLPTLDILLTDVCDGLG